MKIRVIFLSMIPYILVRRKLFFQNNCYNAKLINANSYKVEGLPKN